MISILPNESINSFTEANYSFPLVLSGTLKISRIDSDANELFLYYVEAGETCAVSLNFESNKSEQRIFATTITKTNLIFIPKEYMDKWLVKYSSWRKFVLSTFQYRFTELLNSIDELAFNNLDMRLWNYLTEKSKIYNSNLLQLSHQTIANDLNSSRSVISRLLKQLEKGRKIELQRNKISLNFN